MVSECSAVPVLIPYHLLSGVHDTPLSRSALDLSLAVLLSLCQCFNRADLVLLMAIRRRTVRRPFIVLSTTHHEVLTSTSHTLSSKHLLLLLLSLHIELYKLLSFFLLH